MLIISGDDSTKSREFLNEFIRNKSVVRYLATDLSLERLNQDLEPKNLFLESPIIVIEQLFGRRESKEKKILIESLQKSEGNEIVLWESRKLSTTELKIFANSQHKEFQLKPVIFQFLDSLGDKESVRLFHEVLRDEPAEKTLSAIAGRLHLLVHIIIDPSSLEIKGFYRSKIETQAKTLGSKRLAKAVSKFTEMEYMLKSGNTLNSWESNIDIFLLEL